MRTAQEVYTEYKIQPSLQLHQLRVAGVAKIVTEHFKLELNARDVIAACLLHDMGNILKFDFTVFPDFSEPEGIEYWENIQKEFEQKYGKDQHVATLTIAREIGASRGVLECIDIVAFSKIKQTLTSGTWEQKICEYADCRVAPLGVVSLTERLLEGRQRYASRQQDIESFREDRYQELVDAQRELQREIFSHTDITPEDITEAAVAPHFEALRNYPVA